MNIEIHHTKDLTCFRERPYLLMGSARWGLCWTLKQVLQPLRAWSFFFQLQPKIDALFQTHSSRPRPRAWIHVTWKSIEWSKGPGLPSRPILAHLTGNFATVKWGKKSKDNVICKSSDITSPTCSLVWYHFNSITSDIEQGEAINERNQTPNHEEFLGKSSTHDVLLIHHSHVGASTHVWVCSTCLLVLHLFLPALHALLIFPTSTFLMFRWSRIQERHGHYVCNRGL